MTRKKALFLIDGVHKTDNTIDAIKQLCKRHKTEVSALVWIGGTEKIKDRETFSLEFDNEFGKEVVYPVNEDNICVPHKGIRDVLSANPGIKTVIQLSGAPQIFRSRTIEFAGIAAGYGASYIAGGTEFKELRIAVEHKIPSIGLYATNKRVGKTAFGSYIGGLACGITGSGVPRRPVIITHSRGGPPVPPLIEIYKKAAQKPVKDLSLQELLSSRFRPEYLGRLVDFGLHGASDIFEDALIISIYLDQYERKHGQVPYISLIGCRRAGAGYFNEFVVSNVDRGIKKANRSKADIIIHEGSGAEHPPVEVDTVILLVPADIELEMLRNFPGLAKVDLFIAVNCQKETAPPEKVRQLEKFLKEIKPDASFIRTVFVPEIVHDSPEVIGKRVAFFTTVPDYIINKLAEYLEKTYKCTIMAMYNRLDSDSEMRGAIDRVVEEGAQCFVFEIKARGVEGAMYAQRKYNIPYYYINNIPLVVDEGLNPLSDNSTLNIKITERIDMAAKKFDMRAEKSSGRNI